MQEAQVRFPSRAASASAYSHMINVLQVTTPIPHHPSQTIVERTLDNMNCLAFDISLICDSGHISVTSLNLCFS